MAETDLSEIERGRRAIGRAGYVIATLAIGAGIAAYVLRQPAASRALLAGTMGLLVLLPVLNVVAILFEEIRRRDWPFAFIALTVLALLAFNVARRLFW